MIISTMKTDTTICLNSKVDGKQPSLEHRIYNSEGISTALTTGFLPHIAEPLCSVHPNSHKFEFDPETSIKPIVPALRATDYKAPHCVYEPRHRIRKLTPRECFRLMGVDDKDIDKIQAAGISNTQQYKLAGNSIVVDVLYHIFRKAFCETHNENQQQTLF